LEPAERICRATIKISAITLNDYSTTSVDYSSCLCFLSPIALNDYSMIAFYYSICLCFLSPTSLNDYSIITVDFSRWCCLIILPTMLYSAKSSLKIFRKSFHPPFIALNFRRRCCRVKTIYPSRIPQRTPPSFATPIIKNFGASRAHLPSNAPNFSDNPE
jgi:hypothetical protein